MQVLSTSSACIRVRPVSRRNPHRGRFLHVGPPANERQVKVAAAPKDRVLGAVPYLLPLFDSLRYGKFLFLQYPFFQTALRPVLPLAGIYFSNGFVPLIAFFALYLLVVNNQSLDRGVRYNAMQAILLDIVLMYALRHAGKVGIVIPGVLEGALRPPVDGPFLQVYITGYNTIFLFVFASVAYGMISSLAGQLARIPLVSDAADQQIR